MIDVEIVWENFFLQVSQKLMRIGRIFGGRSGQTRDQFLGRALCANPPLAHPGEMLDQHIDDAITEPAHFVR